MAAGAIVIAGILAVGAPAPTALPAQEPAYEATRVADGVYRFRFRAHNALFVVGRSGVLVIDPISTEASRHLAEAIREVAPGARLHAVVYSHDHADHATGAPVLFEALNEAPILAHGRAAPKIAARGDADFPSPDVTIPDDGPHVIDLGDRRVELHYLGASHSDNMLVAFLPEERIVFAVDFVGHDAVGFRDLPDYHFPALLDAMRRLQGLAYETIVFGHGPSGDHSSVDRQIRYYEELRDAVATALEDGLSEDEAAERIRLDAYREWRGYAEWFSLNVRAIYRILSGTPE